MRSSSAHEAVAARADAQEARQHLRHLHAREAPLARLGVAQHHAEREREVRDVRERPAGPDRERRQDGEDGAVERGRELAALGGRDRRHGQHRDAAPRASSAEQLARRALLWRSTSSRMRVPTRSSTSDGSRSPAVRGRLGESRTASSSSATRTMQNSSRLEEKIAAEAQALEQRDALVAGQLEHARVPLEPRQLAVEAGATARCAFLRAADRHHDASRRSARARAGAGTSAARRAGPRCGSIAAAPAFGKDDARARDGARRAPRSRARARRARGRRRGARSARRGRRRRSRAAPRRRPRGAPSSCAMISAVSCARGYGLVTTHCGSTFSAASARPVARAARRPAATSVRSGSGVPSARSSASACRTRMIATGPA